MHLQSLLGSPRSYIGLDVRNQAKGYYKNRLAAFCSLHETTAAMPKGVSFT